MRDEKISEPPKYTQVHIGDNLRNGKKKYSVVAIEKYGKIRAERIIERNNMITKQPESVVLTEYFFKTDINTDMTIKITGSGNKRDRRAVYE